jgi:hypothetical protein
MSGVINCGAAILAASVGSLRLQALEASITARGPRTTFNHTHS